MIELVASLLGGTLLGLSLAAPPGPMNAVIAEESVIRGKLAGFKAGLGAMTADAVFCALAFAGVVAFIRRASVVKGVMVGIGGFLMLYFAYGAYGDARAMGENTDGDKKLASDGSSGRSNGSKGFRKAFVLAITNPYQITWWLTAGVALIESYSLSVASREFVIGGPLALVGFFGGIGVWITTFPTFLAAGTSRTNSFSKIVAYISALLLAFFGVMFLYDSATTLI